MSIITNVGYITLLVLNKSLLRNFNQIKNLRFRFSLKPSDHNVELIRSQFKLNYAFN